jgi:exodeoxyribonuclease V gamma subunit
VERRRQRQMCIRDRVYWRSRLGVQLQGPEEALQDDENFALQGLERYLLGRSLLEAADAEQQFEAEKIAGQLPMGAAGQMVLKQQFDAAHRVNDRAAAYFEQYPMALSAQSVAVTVNMSWGDVRITADIEGLRQGENGILQIMRRPGAVATGKRDQQTPRADVLINLWPQHVLLCAADWSVRSVVVGLDGVALLPTLLPEDAQQILKQWLSAYVAAWQSPLPVTVKAGLAFVSEQAKSRGTDDSQNDAQQEAQNEAKNDAKNEAKNEAALDKASKAFSDSFSEDNDYSRSLYVQRSFESFEDIREGLPQWAPLLYASLMASATMEGASV